MSHNIPKIIDVLTGKPPAAVRWGLHATTYGPVLLGLTEEGAVCRLEFMKKRKAAAVLKQWQRAWPRTEFIKDARLIAQVLQRIFPSEKNVAPRTIKVHLVGTPFQQRVWKALLTIPAGRVVSYGDLARRIKKPTAARAVGGAVGANPVPILVPCHRVITGDGKLGGYAGGPILKKGLLKAENVSLPAS